MARSPAFWRYTAFQIPGWIIASVGGWWIHRTLEVPIWVAAGVLVAWVIKDYALYPFLRSAYELDYRLPIERMIGELGYATERLSPVGYVRVRGELWRARTDDVNQTVNQGDHIQVARVDGTILVVELRVGTPGPSSSATST